MASADGVTDREKLDLCIQSTAHFEYGSACDTVQRFVGGGLVNQDTADKIKNEIRFRFNNLLKISRNHMDNYNITRNHRKDEPNIRTVVEQATEG